jgi:hypothetical protein
MLRADGQPADARLSPAIAKDIRRNGQRGSSKARLRLAASTS